MGKHQFNPQHFININQTELKEKLAVKHPEVVTFGDLQFQSCSEITPDKYRLTCIITTALEEYDLEEISTAIAQKNIWDESVEIVLDLNAPAKVESILMVNRDYPEWLDQDEKEILKEVSILLGEDARVSSVHFKEVDTLGGEEYFELLCLVYGYYQYPVNDINFERRVWVGYPVKHSTKDSYSSLRMD